METSTRIPLTVENLCKNFGGLAVLSNVSLMVKAGERRAIIGPNGAGKTTLFNVINGVLAPASGRVWLFGKDITHLSPHQRATLGLARTFQVTNLFPGLTVRDNMLLAVQALDRVKFNMIRPCHTYNHLWYRVRDLLVQWQLEDKADVLVKHLSYGEQRQVEIVLTLAGNPKVLLLDEPTAGLAPSEITMVISLIQRLPEEVAILFVDHDMDVAFQIATQITVMHQGMVLAEGLPGEVRCNPRVQEIYLGTE